MDNARALSIVSALANGIDPRTGEVFDPDSPYQTGDVIRALYVAVRALELEARTMRRSQTRRLPQKAGAPWSAEEDEQLIARLRDEGITDLEQLAKLHDRTVAGIQARLERHGLLTYSHASAFVRGRASTRTSDDAL